MQPKTLLGGLTEYGDKDFARFLRRTFAASLGLSPEAQTRPVVGIVNTSSELSSCHRGLPELVEAVKRGVWSAGGLPREFPVVSPGEVYLNPTSMMVRNLLAMDVEVLSKAQPVDSLVLVGGCDKTLPALLMGAASSGLPAIVLASGPMLSGRFEAERVGACTDCRRFWAAFRRGEIDAAKLEALTTELAPTTGTCGVMGTASTMACLCETLGVMLPLGASIPAVHADRLRHAEATGKEATRLASRGPTLASVLTAASFENALRVLQAIGGSTNAVIHLTAIAGRVGLRLDLAQLDALAESTPVLVDLKPTGEHFMEDFHAAGGMPVVLRELKPWLRLDAPTVLGQTLGAMLDGPYTWPDWQKVIRRAAEPLQAKGSLVVLRGSLAPDGALLKRSAATAELMESCGRAVVFRSLADLARRIDDPDLDVKPDDFLVLQNAGLLGAPGMPEAGFLPIPRKLHGVTDMVRISDARMSGTAYGTVVLHVCPEAAAGGPLGLVRDGDRIRLSVRERRLDLLVPEAELQERRRTAAPPAPLPARGYERLFLSHVEPACLGADFDFLRHQAVQLPDVDRGRDNETFKTRGGE